MGNAGKRLSVVRETGGGGAGAGQAGEGRLVLLQPAEDRITERRPAWLVGGRAALERPGLVQEHEVTRVLHGKRPEEHLIEEREDRRVRSDTEGQ